MITDSCDQNFRLCHKLERLLEAVYLQKVPTKSDNYNTAHDYQFWTRSFSIALSQYNKFMEAYTSAAR